MSNEEQRMVRICAYCHEVVEIKTAGDESWDYCAGCHQIEGPTLEITEEQYEKEHQ
jgi:hypothetical protein